MHVRTQFREAMRERLVAANVAGGEDHVFTHDPRLIGQAVLPLVVIDPEMEPSITAKGPRVFSIRRGDGKKTGRPLLRRIQASLKIYAEPSGPKDQYGNFTSIDVDADKAADEILAAVEAALFDGDNRLTIDGQPFGEIDLMLLGTGGIANPETGMRQVGALHMLVEATLMTDEGDPTVVSNRV